MKKERLILILPVSVLAILLVVSIVTSGFNFKKEAKLTLLSVEEAGQMVIEYINKNVLEGQSSASLVEIGGLDTGDLYKFKIDIDGQTFDSYITRDGSLLFPQAIDLEAQPNAETEGGDSLSTEVSKRDLPDIKLFIMSYCPFGLQVQKAILPVYSLLKDKANIKIHFVDYIMHDKKEIDENLRQYCIQKENPQKYVEYLSCFVKEDNYSKCLEQVKADKNKLKTCIADTDEAYKVTEQYNNKDTWLNGRYPKFELDAALNTKYGVGGSPTIVINDQTVRIDPRTPERFKEVICQSFNLAPKECSEILSSDTPSSGFGGGTGSSGDGSCQ